MQGVQGEEVQYQGTLLHMRVVGGLDFLTGFIFIICQRFS